MGWTGLHATHYDKKGKVDRKAECDARFLEDLCKGHYKILRSRLIGSVYYAAITTLRKYVGEDADGRSIYESIPENEQTIWGCVMLTSVDNNNYYNFNYKDMSEDMGPCCYDCPESILNLLSPTNNEYANEWRKKCRDRIEKKKRLGKVQLGQFITFIAQHETTSGVKPGDAVTLMKKRSFFSKRNYWYDGRYKWGENMIPDDFTVVPL